MNKIIGIVPARIGSKSVPKKNIMSLKNYPLIAYSIIVSKLSNLIEKTIVSTDSVEIKEIAEKYDAEVPFLRPTQYAQDKSTDLEWVKHFIYWWHYKAEKRLPTYIVHLRPTTPLRNPKIIDLAIKAMLSDRYATALRSVHPYKETPYKSFKRQNGYLKPIFEDKRKEFYNLPRQELPTIYKPNGYVDIIRTDVVLQTDTLHGDDILGFSTENVDEIDTIEDFDYIEWKLEKYSNICYDYLKKHYKAV